MAASDVIPGLFMLPVPINKDINIDKDVVKTKLRDLDHFLSVRRGRSEELAILNLQGLLTLRLRHYEDAVGYFKDVLKRDPENLNALANLQYVLEKVFRLAEARAYKEKRNKLIQDTSEEGAQERRNARCLAEQAYAYAYDIHSETIGGKRYTDSNKLYIKALELGGTAVESVEKDDWKFCLAINAHKLFDNLYYELGKTSALGEYIDIVVKYFSEVIQSVPGDPELQWDSWRHLADLFRGMKHRKIDRNVPPKLKEFKDDPEKCMLEAMKVSPNNARLLTRYANFLFSLDKKKLGKPLELLEQSIRLDSSEFNFYAFTTRAMINIKFYENQTESSGQDDPNRSVLRNVLQLAKTDLEKAMSMHVTPWDLASLGNVYYLLANHHTEQDIEIRSLIEKALLYFTKAADCQDGHKQSGVHVMRGCCLFAIGENRSAVECYKQAIDTELPKTTTYTGNFNGLLNVYLSMLRDKENIKDISIMAEISFSLKEALLKYKRYNMTKYCISKYRFKYKNELQQLEKYCQQFKELCEVASLLNVSGEPPIRPSQERLIKDKEGETLRQSWNNTQDVSSEERTREGTTAPRDSLGSSTAQEQDPHLAKRRSAADGNEDEGTPEERAEDVSSLEQGVQQMDIREPKQQPIRKTPENARTDFKYDFYVIYPESEGDWVSYRLLNELEAVRKLKGCIHDRDAVPGSYKIDSDLDLMENSANIILVINKDCGTVEFKDRMNYALGVRRKCECAMKIIPVLRDFSKVPDEIDLIMNCFDATGAVNWVQLANRIEQQI